jgi:homocysteine S-methyltransferase
LSTNAQIYCYHYAQRAVPMMDRDTDAVGTTPTLLERWLAVRRPLVVDGGLATELERAGYDLSESANKLWSAAVLAAQPDAIRAVHADYLDAGADVITTSSYQLSEEGVAQAGLAGADCAWDTLLRRSVALALAARDAHAHSTGASEVALIAASCGPLGAVYGDGSEYTGAYGAPGDGPVVPLTPALTPGRQSLDTLMAFHRKRLAVLVTCPGVDLVAFETIPCLLEVTAIATLLAREFPQVRAWVSMTCRDGATLSSGEPLAAAVQAVEAIAPAQVVAVGVNCVHPAIVESCIATMLGVPQTPSATATNARASSGPWAHRRRAVVYPNRGELFDAQSSLWVDRPAAGTHACMTPNDRQFLEMARRWAAVGAWAIGGCCRTTPALVGAIKREIEGHSA